MTAQTPWMELCADYYKGKPLKLVRRRSYFRYRRIGFLWFWQANIDTVRFQGFAWSRNEARRRATSAASWAQTAKLGLLPGYWKRIKTP